MSSVTELARGNCSSRGRYSSRRFFFQAEDGIRDTSVTGVQTCALPIFENLIKDPTEAPAVIELPEELERWQREDSPQVGVVQKRLREELTKWFAKGYAAKIGRASCREREWRVGVGVALQVTCEPRLTSR